jgi:ArsR family transcriptional regulator, arsenate/arsenite/antimonite-responsive transcriptional repressor
MARNAAQSAFEALSDPTRRRILRLLSESEETSAGAVADAIDEVGRTAVSSHLRVLRNADLIVERKEGRYRYYSLDPEGPVQDALGFLQSILSQGVARDDSDVGNIKPVDRALSPKARSKSSAARARRVS